MVWPAIIGAAGSIGSGLLGMFGASKQNKAARQAAQAQMEFQERMSSTAYQRAMADMKKAGLNPMLAYKMGGASSPAGAMPNIQNELAPLQTGVSNAANSAMSLETARLNNKILKQQERKTRYEADRLKVLNPVYQKGGEIVQGGISEGEKLIKNVNDWLFGPPDTVEQTSATDGSENETIPPGGTSKSARERKEEFTKVQENIRKTHERPKQDHATLFREWQLALSKGLKISFKEYKRRKELLAHRRTVQNYQRSK